jgi:hypothetical protein
VNDAATGQPTPVRIRFTDAEGTYYAPFGRLTRFATDTAGDMAGDVGGSVLLHGQAYAYIDGACEIALPPGLITVAISKGPEFRPVYEELTLPPGKLALRFSIERWVDLRAEGWYSGDTRCHILSPHAALLEGAAEDVAVVNLLALEYVLHGPQRMNYPAFPNLLAFSGQSPALERPGHMVVVNTMNQHPSLGLLLLLNCHRIVYPLTAGKPGHFQDWTLADWCDQCHRKGGLVIGEFDFVHPLVRRHGEVLADLIGGRVDALQPGGFDHPEVDYDPGEEAPLEDWYRLLDCGFRIPLVAGSGKECNREEALGDPRTYAFLGPGQSLTYKNWIEAVRAGRTFVTNGPLVTLSVNDQPPGTTLDLPAEAGMVRVRAEARSLSSLDGLEIVANRRVVAAAKGSQAPAHAAVEAEVRLPEGGWILARCWGPYDDAIEQWHAAQTSPVYVQVDGRRPPADAAAVAVFMESLQKMLRWVEQEGRFENEQQRQRLARIFESARDTLLSRSTG